MNTTMQIWIDIINLSLSASLVAAVVLLLRVLLKKIPKFYSYLLWLIVFFRFLCPFTIQSVLSLIPVKHKAIAFTDSTMQWIAFDTGIKNVDLAANYAISNYDSLPLKTEGFSSSKMLILVLSILWLIGMISLFIVITIRYRRLRSKLKTATLVSKKSKNSCEIYETDQIQSPFLLGLFNPRVYVPVGMEEQELQYVLSHEQMHVRGKDYLVKPLCFLAVMIHWFNPMVWISFYAMVKDMELSCDEAVIRKSEEDIRSKYSSALLNISMKQSGLILPIAFGESNTKSRIKNILKFKKPATWIGIIGVLVVIVATVTLLTSSKNSVKYIPEKINTKESNSFENVSVSTQIINRKTLTKSMQRVLAENRTPYIGDHVKVKNLIGALPVPGGLEYDHIELQTKEEPYELTVFYNLKEGAVMDTAASNTAISNAILLFSTVENMGICRFQITTREDTSSLVYNREDLEKSFDELYPWSADTGGIKELYAISSHHIKYVNLNQSVSKAIMDFNKNDYKETMFKTESHDILTTDESKNKIIVYAMALYQEYGYEDGEFKSISGNHMPVAITFTVNAEGEYSMEEYWIPKDGSYYEASIREKFPNYPGNVEKNAMNTQKYIDKQQAECDEKAKQFLNDLKSEANVKKQEFQKLLNEIKN